MATTRRAQELENRRRLAIARINDRSVRLWVADFRLRSKAGLATSVAPVPARPSRGRARLAKPATEFGFATELWNAPYVAAMIGKTFGVIYHPRYLNEWLIAWGITPQKPRRVPGRATRPESTGGSPRYCRGSKKVEQDGAYLVLIDEGGFQMAPLVRRTQDPRGQTPVIKQRAALRANVSGIAALSRPPRRNRLGMYFRTRPNGHFDSLAIDNLAVAGFLRKLMRYLRAEAIMV